MNEAKQVLLNIDESKVATFLAFIRTLDYVSIADDEQNIPQWQQDEVNRRLNSIENGEMQVQDWDVAKDTLFK